MPSEGESWLSAVARVLLAETDDLRELAGIAGLDPASMYIGTRMDGADLRGQDLRGMAFTGLDRSKVRTDALTLLDEVEAELEPVLDIEPEPEPDRDFGALILFQDPNLEFSYRRQAASMFFRNEVFGPGEEARFLAASRDFEGAKLVIGLCRDEAEYRSFPHFGDFIRIIGVDGREDRFRAISSAIEERSQSKTILTPLSGGINSLRRETLFSVSMRNLVTFASAEWLQLDEIIDHGELWTFISTRGDAADPEAAWFQLFSRAWKLGLHVEDGFRLGDGRGDVFSGLGAGLAFPGTGEFAVGPEGGWPAFGAAVLLWSEPLYRDESYLKAVRRILDANRWRLHTVSGLDLRMWGATQHLDIRVEPELPMMRPPPLPYAAIGINPDTPILVSEQADAGTILWALAVEGRLLLNLQDLRWLNPNSWGPWLTVGHQVRRIARTMSGPSRSLYIAALVRQALELGRVNGRDGTGLAEMLAAPDLVQHGGLDISLIGFDETQVAFTLKIPSGYLHPLESSRVLVLAIDAGGPSVRRRSVAVVRAYFKERMGGSLGPKLSSKASPRS